MIKLLTTLVRGAVCDAEQAVFDQNATLVLAQQLRDAAAALELAKKELACAMAHRSSEARAATSLQDRIKSLEQAAVDALTGGRPDLAEETATVIAAVEDERKDREIAIERFDVDIARLQGLTEEGARRLRELGRGLEMARAQEALNRAGANGRRALITGSGALRDAEATLARIRENQTQLADASAALDELDKKTRGVALDERLAAAGFGPNTKTKPSDILERIRSRAATPATPATRSPEKQ